ncbi:Protein unc-1 domain protein [Brugia pahangi]
MQQLPLLLSSSSSSSLLLPPPPPPPPPQPQPLQPPQPQPQPQPSSSSTLSRSQSMSQSRSQPLSSSIKRLKSQKQQLFHEYNSKDAENRWMQDVIEKLPVRARSQSWLIRTRHLLDDTKEKAPFISSCLYVLSVILVVITFPFCLPFCFKIIREYERAVVMRLGRLISGGTKGPGLFFIMPCIDTFHVVDLRVLSFDVPAQEILSRDSVTVSVEAVIFFRINNPVISVTNVNDAQFSTKLLAQTTLRNVLGTRTLSEMLSERDNIANVIEKVLAEGTEPWGVHVQRVEIKDIRLPYQLMRSMAAEAGAARDARSLIILADGERQASWSLAEAASTIGSSSVSLQLRYLQTLTNVASEHNSTIVIPIPMEIARYCARKWCKFNAKNL